MVIDAQELERLSVAKHVKEVYGVEADSSRGQKMLV